jgi:hypothetical protein
MAFQEKSIFVTSAVVRSIHNFPKCQGSTFPAKAKRCVDCGSSLYAQPTAMSEVTVIKAGSLDGGAADIQISIERFTRSRKSYCTPVEGATQANTMV